MSDDGVPLLHFVDGREVAGQREGLLGRALRFLRAPFASTWRHRDLFVTLLRREIADRFKGSVGGWVWGVIGPVLALVTYTVMFNGSPTLPNNEAAKSSFDYALFIFGGLVVFNFFAEMAYRAPSLLHEYAYFLKQTMFPADILAIVVTLRAAVYAAISLAMMLAFQLVLSGTLHWTTLLLIFWVVPLLMFLIGLTWLLSAFGAFTRDIAYLIMSIMPLLMFTTPVFYSHEILPSPMNVVFYVNVLTGYIEIARDLIVWGRVPNPWVCLWTLAYSAAFFWAGYWLFARNKDGIADVV